MNGCDIRHEMLTFLMKMNEVDLQSWSTACLEGKGVESKMSAGRIADVLTVFPLSGHETHDYNGH